MKPTQYILTRPLVFIALLAIAINGVLWGVVVDAAGVTFWARLAAIGLVSIPALANLALGLVMRLEAQPAVFYIPASVSSFLGIGLFVFQATEGDAQSGIAFIVLWALLLLALPLSWGLAFALRHVFAPPSHELPRMPGSASPTT